MMLRNARVGSIGGTRLYGMSQWRMILPTFTVRLPIDISSYADQILDHLKLIIRRSKLQWRSPANIYHIDRTSLRQESLGCGKVSKLGCLVQPVINIGF